MKRTEWITRIFLPIADNGLLPGNNERIEGTPARVRFKLAGRDAGMLDKVSHGKWSIKKELVHLIILDELWKIRIDELEQGSEVLKPADMTNQATHESELDQLPLGELMTLFEDSRSELVNHLRQLDDTALLNSSLHPRLKQPMRIIDMANFIAEHDDHHLVQMTCLLSEMGRN
jgi:uncharacterized damage-inducible protein DinB